MVFDIRNTPLGIGARAFESCSRLANLIIPDTVVATGGAFERCESLTNVVVGSGLTNIGGFAHCEKLASVTLGNRITRIDPGAFAFCSSLPGITIPESVTEIGWSAFESCTNLTSVTLPKSLSELGYWSFSGCSTLAAVYFTGDAIIRIKRVFDDSDWVTVYYMPGTQGWGPTYGGRPTMLWNPQVQTSDSTFGVGTNGFGFTIAGTSGLTVVVEGCSDLSRPTWLPLATNTLAGGSSYFSDAQWASYPARNYRIRSP